MRIRAVQIDNLEVRTNKMNERIRKLIGVRKGVDDLMR